MQIIKPWRFYLLFILLGLAAFYVYTRSEADIPMNQPLDQFPQRAGDWVMTGQARFDERVLAVLLPTDYLSRSYVDSKGNSLSLYIGFHNGGPNSGPIHSPKQCLPGSGWNHLTEVIRHVTVNGEDIPYVVLFIKKILRNNYFSTGFKFATRF